MPPSNDFAEECELQEGQLLCRAVVDFYGKYFPPGLVEMTMAALQDVDAELTLQKASGHREVYPLTTPDAQRIPCSHHIQRI